MKAGLIILGYLKWHYSKALISLSRVWKIFLRFIAEYFSLKLLIGNFFDPWKRMSDSYPKGFVLKEYFYAWLTNLIMRVTGMILRLGLIIIGLICYASFALLYPVALAFWLILPLIVIGLIIDGIILII